MVENTDSYSYSRACAWKSYGSRLSGCPNGFILTVSNAPLSNAAASALQKSLSALGYGYDAITYLITDPQDNVSLDENELFGVIESVDPGILLIADRESHELVERAYRQAIPRHTALRVFGRETRALGDMEGLMATSDGRQKIWATLKTLPILK